MKINIGIVGAGLIGRLLAMECLQRGYQVTLFDQDTCEGKTSCGYVAAGMVAPYTELEANTPLMLQLGLEAIHLWPQILKNLTVPVTFHFTGTLIVSHRQDVAELSQFHSALQDKLNLYKNNLADDFILKKISREKMEAFVPGISPHIQEGFWISDEGNIDTNEFFSSTTSFLHEHHVKWFENTKVTLIKPNEIEVQNNKYYFDLVCDTRGLGAKSDWPGLRGIRGELLWLQTKDIQLQGPVRLLHPRYTIYVSPRANNMVVVGATSFESEDTGPIFVESILGLLSAAYTIHPEFSKARLVNTLTQARPAFRDHHPKMIYQDGLLRINGLYRNGYLAGPAVIRDAMCLIENEKKSVKFPELLNDEGNVV